MYLGSLSQILNESNTKPTIKDRVQGAAKGAIKYAVPGAMAGTVLGTGTWNAYGILGGAAAGLTWGAAGGAVHGFINPDYHKEFIDKDLKSFANHPIDYVAKNPGKTLAGAGGALVGATTAIPGPLMFGKYLRPLAPAVIGAGAVGGSRLFSKLYDKPRNKSSLPMAVGAGIGGVTGFALGSLATMPSGGPFTPVFAGAGATTGALAGAYLGSRDWFGKEKSNKKKIKKLKEQSELNLYNYIDEAVDLLVDTAVIYFLETFDSSLLYCLSNGIYGPILEEAEQQQNQGNKDTTTVSDGANSTAQKTTEVLNQANKALNQNSDKKGFIDRIIAKLKEWLDKLTSKSNESKSEGKTADANKLNAAANTVKATINQAENKAEEAEKKEENEKKEVEQTQQQEKKQEETKQQEQQEKKEDIKTQKVVYRGYNGEPKEAWIWKDANGHIMTRNQEYYNIYSDEDHPMTLMEALSGVHRSKRRHIYRRFAF